MAFVNLSGGVGVPYLPGQDANDIRAIGEGVHAAYDEILVPAGMGDVAIYTEMGRFMIGPYGCVVTRAVHEKRIYKDYIGVDACAVDLIRPAMYGAYHHLSVVGQPGGPTRPRPRPPRSTTSRAACARTTTSLPSTATCRPSRRATLSSCTTRVPTAMPWATTTTAACAPPVLLREDGAETELIRRRETPMDYFATLDVLPEAFANLAAESEGVINIK